MLGLVTGCGYRRRRQPGVSNTEALPADFPARLPSASRDPPEPRHTLCQVWNKRRRDEVLLDVDDVAAGHISRMRLNPRISGSTWPSRPTRRWSAARSSTRSRLASPPAPVPVTAPPDLPAVCAAGAADVRAVPRLQCQWVHGSPADIEATCGRLASASQPAGQADPDLRAASWPAAPSIPAKAETPDAAVVGAHPGERAGRPAAIPTAATRAERGLRPRRRSNPPSNRTRCGEGPAVTLARAPTARWVAGSDRSMARFWPIAERLGTPALKALLTGTTRSHDPPPTPSSPSDSRAGSSPRMGGGPHIAMVTGGHFSKGAC